jgi:sugar lactone lactonase YvrE
MQYLMHAWMIAGLCASLLVLSVAALANESSGDGRARIRPSVARIKPGATQQYRVVLDPLYLRAARAATKVDWTVNGIAGGNARYGTIDSAGLYRAPGNAPQPCEVHIGATVKGVANPHLWATALVGASQSAYKLVAKWDVPADGKHHLKDPAGIAVEADGNLLIADFGCSLVFRYKPDGTFIREIGKAGGDLPGVFANPRSVAVDKTGRIFVADVRTGPPRIQAFDRDGKCLYAFGEKGIEPGQIMMPQGMAFDPSGRLVVADADNMRVTIFHNDGTLADAWQRTGVHAGEFNEPYGIVTDANGDVFVSSYYGPCQKFTGKGHLLFGFAHADPPHGPVAFTSATGDRWGNVFLATRDSGGLVDNYVDPDPKSVTMLKYNNNGDLVATIPLWKDECGENASTVDAHDRLYVLFKRGKKVGVAIFEPR